MEMERKWEHGRDQWPPSQELLVRVSLSVGSPSDISLTPQSVSKASVPCMHFLMDSAFRSGLESTRGYLVLRTVEPPRMPVLTRNPHATEAHSECRLVRKARMITPRPPGQRHSFFGGGW